MKKYNPTVGVLVGLLLQPCVTHAQVDPPSASSASVAEGAAIAEGDDAQQTTPPTVAEGEVPMTAEIVNDTGVAATDNADSTTDVPARVEESTTVDLTGQEGSSTPTLTSSSDDKPKDTLSVDFPDEDIRNILRNVADLFELNIVIPDILQGRTSVKLRDVSWRQIFKVVLTPVGYTFVEDGNIIKVVTLESLAQEPLNTEVYILNYARAEEIKPSIDTLVNATGGGRVQVDKRINALIISERPSILSKIAPVLRELDRATEQVMIESKFVEVTNRDIRNIGVNWASLQNYQIGAGDLSRSRDETNTRTDNRAGEFQGTSNNSLTTTGSSSTATSGSTDALTNLSQLIRGNQISTVTTSVFSADDFNVILSALKSNNESRLVSNPTLVTLNNSEATISIGEEYPIPSYNYNTERGSFEVDGFEYKTIGILLKVTPQVNSKGFIRLLLEPEVSSQAGTTSFGGAGGAEIPIIATRKTKTQVTLKDGYTMGIGGLVEQTDFKGETKVPVLGEIPGIGHLFRSKSNNEIARNLLVFITAKTVSPDGAPIEQVFDPRVLRKAGLKADQLPGYRDGSDPFGPSDAEIAAQKAAEAKAAKKAAR